MPSNNTGRAVEKLVEAFPGRIATLQNPGAMRRVAWPHAIDNGAFAAWSNGEEWDEAAFYRALSPKWGSPIWTVVPDVVSDKEGTLRRWEEHSPRVPGEHAFAVQDGMTPDDVPDGADVVFVGGTTQFKWRTLRMWTANFPRVHVGRVNTYRLLWMAHEAGAESCDGTGWFRGCKKQLDGLWRYLEESEGDGPPQMDLGLEETACQAAGEGAFACKPRHAVTS